MAFFSFSCSSLHTSQEDCYNSSLHILLLKCPEVKDCRQGEALPLLPYLFNLCLKRSHALFSRDPWCAHFKSAAEKQNEITWVGKTRQELATLDYREGRGGCGSCAGQSREYKVWTGKKTTTTTKAKTENHKLTSVLGIQIEKLRLYD